MKPNTDLKRLAARSGFTLVELLVVITVIGILAALIFRPKSSEAESGADQMRGNLRQIGMGLRMYVDDNNETFPPAHSEQLPLPWDPGGHF
jgi:prepilin-type N-terminal cleavage/methylation domain-containing protein